MPTNFIRSGRYRYITGSIDSRNYNGYYWKLDLLSDVYAGDLYFYSTFFRPQDYYEKGLGLSVRCLVPLDFFLVSNQLPTYSGTKSYQNLLVEVYGGQDGWNWPSTKLDTIVQNIPINLTRSGAYRFDSGSLTYYPRTIYGDFWESNPYSATSARLLLFYSTNLYPQASNNKGYGFTVRCLVR